MSGQLDRIVGAAVEQGLLAGVEHPPGHDTRPWSVLVLTAIAAWFAAIPFGAVLVFTALTGRNDAGRACALALAVLGLAVFMLRKCRKSRFLEQLGVSGLIIGVALVAHGLNETRMPITAQGAAALLALALAFVIPQAWLRMLLGAAGTWVAAEAIENLAQRFEWHALPPVGIWELLTVCWLLGHLLLARQDSKPRCVFRAAVLEAVLAGSGAIIVLMLARVAGNTFLLSESLPENFWRYAGTYDTRATVSVVFGLLGAGWMARQWPSLRSHWFVAAAAIAAPLCWLSEPLGGVLFVAAYTATSGRPRLAILAGAAALWILGSIYYQLDWPLVYKGSLLLGCGLAYGAIARFGFPAQPEPTPLVSPAPQPSAPGPDTVGKRRVFAVAGLVVFVLANALIWQKEALIRQGQPVFVELAPVDPRSLLQGDYMRLGYALPSDLAYSEARRVLFVARRGPNGVVSLLGPHEGNPLAGNELLIETVRKEGAWMIATDAWYFAEGEAERWAPARYGEFRVDATGKALLVSLRGKNLEPL